uniref:uncharacterized protein LOC120335569 isoform X1 n=1 Tax=Styela clava TaxID=7725 RepID=UPI0019397920|nr:uncharacterized protein LOC120335569 isoform X1 [Styela clava]
MGNSVAKLAALDIGIQLLAFLPSSYFKTERFYDLVGSSTFLCLGRLGLYFSQNTFRQKFQANPVSAWAIGLGLFIFYRFSNYGVNRRFDEVQGNPSVFLQYWMLQGVWVFLTMLPFLLNNAIEDSLVPTTLDKLGWGMFRVGFLTEVIADYQKFTFRKNPENSGKFISHGLWSICRHPNLFGETLLCSGLTVTAFSSFKNWEWWSINILSFTCYLQTRVDEIPTLEQSELNTCDNLSAYRDYIKTVPKLIPFPCKTLRWK